MIKVANEKKKKVVKRPKRKAMRLLFFGVFSVAFIVYFLSYIANVAVDIMNKYKEKEKLSLELMELKEKEQELSTDVEKLKDPEYVGRYLREKFLYSKEGELVIKMPDEKKDSIDNAKQKKMFYLLFLATLNNLI